MLNIAMGMLLGSMMVLFLTELPHFTLSASILLLVVYFLTYFKKASRNVLSFILATAFGFSITAATADYHQRHRFPASLEGQNLIVSGQVDSLVKINAFSRSFLFDVSSARLPNQMRPINWNGTIRLSIYNKQPRVKAGQRWQFVVRLKRGSGFVNSAGFDYEKWLFAQRIEAKGYLRKSDQHKLLAKAPWYSINALRETIHHKITTTLDAVSNQALVSALILAEKSAVSKAQWAVFRATGTSHLMAISGLHIGLVASSGLALVWLLWWCFPRLNLYLPHRLAGSFVGVIFAIFYAMLAGMTIPTQRALTMVVIGLLLLANRQNISGYRILALAMIVVLLMDPLATLTVGFYLSFAAVLVILWLVKRVVKAGRFSLLSLQGFLSLLMIPLSLLFFGEGSLVSPLANLLAIPWVSFIIVPLSMLSVLLSFISDSLSIYLFQFLSIHLNALYALLAFLAKAPSATVESFHLPHYLLAASLVAGVILLMPMGLAWRYTAGFILLPLILYEVATLEKHNEFRLTVLDVGQGLAVMVETKHHSLLFDTGNRSGDSFDLGDMVVVPYLKQRSIKRLDALVISHDDQDHMGGLESVLKHTTVTAFYGNRLGLLQSRANTLCKAGDAWQWDGVDFEFIHPTVDWQGSDNDRSCVLKIRAGKHAVLLTGDIQRKAEKYLVKQSQHSGDLLAADILLMPHHGSNTSSKQYFIRAVNPRWAIASAGYRSRFRHPDHRVLKRYQQHGVTVLNTAQSGAIQFHIKVDQAIGPPKEYRLINQRFWSCSTPLP